METGFRSSCVAYSRPCRVISSESFTPSSRHLPWRWQRLPLLTSPPLMPFSIDHYPASPSPLLASAQSESAGCSRTLPGTPPPHPTTKCGRCSREMTRLRLATLAVCFDLIRAAAHVPSQVPTIPRRPKAIVTQPRPLKCLLSMRRRSSAHFGDLINTGGLLSRVSPLFLLPSHLLPPCLTWLHLTRHSFIGSPPRTNMVPH